jgi:hypothetical protein
MILTKEQKREISRRLENWGRWYYGGVNVVSIGSDQSPFPAYRLASDNGPRAESGKIPVLTGEAHDTDRVLRGMHPELAKALKIHHLSKGTPKSKAQRCKCRVVRTYYRRVERAEMVFNRLCYPKERHGGHLMDGPLVDSFLNEAEGCLFIPAKA